MKSHETTPVLTLSIDALQIMVQTATRVPASTLVTANLVDERVELVIDDRQECVSRDANVFPSRITRIQGARFDGSVIVLLLTDELTIVNAFLTILSIGIVEVLCSSTLS